MADSFHKVGRIAPSPSGLMHLGNAFSALIAWASARSRDGKFLLRLEDLDERCRKKDLHDQLLDDLIWLGLDWDDTPVVQSRRLDLYEEALEKISSQACVYPCFCTRADLHAASAPHASDGTPVYAGTCFNIDNVQRQARVKSERFALRLHVPDASISFIDTLQGKYTQRLSCNCGDFVLKRSDGIYAYQLACVVDDIASGITDIVRGNDLLSSTPRQIYLYQLLGADIPRYMHHPLLIAADGRRLAKRDEDLTIISMRNRGVTAEFIIGYIAYLVGFTKIPQAMSSNEFLDEFDISKLPAENIVVDYQEIKTLYL